MAGAAGLLLLAMGAPRLIAGVQVGMISDVVWDVETKRPVSEESLAAAVAALAGADRWEAAGERRGMQAFLLMRSAEQAVDEKRRALLYREAMAAAEAAVARGPIQPHVWAMSAALRRHFGDSPGAARALRASFLSGAAMRDITIWRLELAMSLTPWMDQEMQTLLRRQIRLAWVMFPGEVARLGDDAASSALVRNALNELSEEEVAHYLRLHGGN